MWNWEKGLRLISPRSEQNMEKLAPAATIAKHSPEQTVQLARQGYARRTLIETVISVVKRKLSARAPGYSFVHANPPSPAARLGIQPSSPEASLNFPQDANRTNQLLGRSVVRGRSA